MSFFSRTTQNQHQQVATVHKEFMGRLPKSLIDCPVSGLLFNLLSSPLSRLQRKY